MDQDTNTKPQDNTQSATTPNVSATTSAAPVTTTPVTPAAAVESTPSATAPSTTATDTSVSSMGTTPTTPDALQPSAATDGGVTPPPVQNPSAPQGPGYAQTKSHKMMFIIIAIVVLVVSFLTALFFFRQLTGNATAEVEVSPSPKAVTSPTKPPVSPTVTPVNEEEAELQEIDLGTVDESLKDIETDIGTL